MRILYHKNFLKNFKKRISRNIKLLKKTRERIQLFKEDPTNPLLNDHQLIGDMNRLRSFSITGDVRLIYYINEESEFIFMDIGTHNQVYN